MENLTDEQVTTWKSQITHSLFDLSRNLLGVESTCISIKYDVVSNDPSLANSWTNLSRTISGCQSKITDNTHVLEDTLSTYVKTIQAINQEMVSTVDLADNEFKGYIDRINAI